MDKTAFIIGIVAMFVFYAIIVIILVHRFLKHPDFVQNLTDTTFDALDKKKDEFKDKWKEAEEQARREVEEEEAEKKRKKKEKERAKKIDKNVV